jgi:hypothetical protein
MLSSAVPAAPKGLEELKLYKDLGLLGAQECTQRVREHIADGTHKDPTLLTCARHIWIAPDFRNKPKNEALATLNTQRKCAYFYPYSPGYSPSEHRELQRETRTQWLLIFGMLSAALIGALAAIAAQLISR